MMRLNFRIIGNRQFAIGHEKNSADQYSSGHSYRRFLIAYCLLLISFWGCKGDKKEAHSGHKSEQVLYTCSMHPGIIRDKPGKCPICGMDLIVKATDEETEGNAALNELNKSANSIVISSIPVITIQREERDIEVEALGSVAYDTRQVGAISSRVSGRIEKLYVRYRFQKVSKGQKIIDIYSPELMTAQENLLFLIKNDPENFSLINAAKSRLSLLGLSFQQIEQILKSGKPALSVSIYSNYSGHIHEARANPMIIAEGEMRDIANITEELSLKEGMYIEKGQTIFTVYNPNKAWALLNVHADLQSLVKTGNFVRIIPETAPHKNFRAAISFIEPFYRIESKSVTVRVPFDNSRLQIPIGSQVKASIFGNSKIADWLPLSSVISLGLGKVVFLKQGVMFKAHEVETGVAYRNKIQIVGGLTPMDTVALNAQFLMDSEGFIKIKE